MFLTIVLRAKPKTKNVLVMCESIASGHRLNSVRERTGDKLEFIRFDPTIQQESIYREIKKLKGVKVSTAEQRMKSKFSPTSYLMEDL
ncbi:39S ribosomal protein L33, mitochondrial [Frankliniella fusca]|uniref:Large ribosomal subunit protein bL33m n=1 Tax=Frankliniella fusca TaxID=407009 RepID=A0AAE1LMJ7_9NEOP|nr:39S ribosomal protein L33, mitochondrial [Frankliniella fusca]